MKTLVLLCAAAALSAAVTPVAAGQDIARRLRGIEDGKVRFSYASKRDVCGNGRGQIGFGNGRRTVRDGRGRGRGWGSDDWESDCENGPVRVQLRVREGAAYDIDTYVGGRWRPNPRALDLGRVSAESAVAYLISIAETAGGDVAGDAIFPAMLADSVSVWPDLLRLARDRSLSRDTRKSAVFWLGQAAGAAATAGLDSIARDPDEEREIRFAAIFALSQRPEDEGVPLLIGIARTHPDFELRKRALFWLGQSDDPRSLDLFEEILSGR